MQNLLLSGVKSTLLRLGPKATGLCLSQRQSVLPALNSLVNRPVSTTANSRPPFTFDHKRISLFSQGMSPANPALVARANSRASALLCRSQSTSSGKPDKKPSKFKQFYSQYGPMFVVVHLITVAMWIYGFFLISKQGYDITQLLNVFEKVNLMSEETVKNIHFKIDNYKTESAWITGQNIKHFATAYMVYKVIAPFRYAVSIALVRSLIKVLRARGLMR